MRSSLMDIKMLKCVHPARTPLCACVNVSVIMSVCVCVCVCVVTQCAEGALGPSFKGREILISPRLH